MAGVVQDFVTAVFVEFYTDITPRFFQLFINLGHSFSVVADGVICSGNEKHGHFYASEPRRAIRLFVEGDKIVHGAQCEFEGAERVGGIFFFLFFVLCQPCNRVVFVLEMRVICSEGKIVYRF